MSIDRGKFSRRELLRRSVATAAFAAAGSAWGPLLAAPASRWFKIGACDWSLEKRCDPRAFDVAKTIGLDGVQVEFCTAQKRNLRDAEAQEEYRRAAARSGLAIASLALGELSNVPLKSDPRALQWLGESIEVCKALGLGIVMPAFFGRGEIDMQRTGEIDHVVRALRKSPPRRSSRGSSSAWKTPSAPRTTCGCWIASARRRSRSTTTWAVRPTGGATSSRRSAALGKRICEFHFKDAGYMLGQGRIDFKAVRRALDEIHYSGWIQIEAAAPHGLIADYTADLKYLRRLFPPRG